MTRETAAHASRVVVMARGLATRMRAAEPAAALVPDQAAAADAGLKTLMPVGGRPFLDFVLSSLADAGFTRAGLVIGPEHNELRRRYGSDVRPRRLTLDLVEQRDPIGTANAVLSAESWTAGQPFVVVNADNLYPVEALTALAALPGPGLLAFERDDLVRSSDIPLDRIAAFALLDVDREGSLRRIVEKPGSAAAAAAGGGALVGMNAWRFDRRIFDACRDVPRSPRGEFELPLAVALALERGVPFHAIRARGPVLDLSRRSDVADVSRRLSGRVPEL